MDRTSVKILRNEIENAINEAIKNSKSGLNLKFDGIGNISFNDLSCSFKVKIDDVKEATKLSSTGSYVPADFQRGAFFLGMPESTYGAIINLRGKDYKLVSINTRAPKYPFVAECLSDGKKYKLPSTFKQDFINATK